MTVDVVKRDVIADPIWHSWYHFSCFHQILGYALSCDRPWGMDYAACREATYTLAANEEYPFFRISHQDQPDPRLRWSPMRGSLVPDLLRNALADGGILIALRDLYDVAGFRHFGRAHHPNWYLLTGFDKPRRTFSAFVELGARDEARDARCYGVVELTEAEVVFTGRRASEVFTGVIGVFPHYAALVVSCSDAPADLVEQEAELIAAVVRRSDDEAPLFNAADRVEGFAPMLDSESLAREQFMIRLWGRKLRALQVLSARRKAYRGCGHALATAMRTIDELLASGLFWEAQARSVGLNVTRLVARQKFFAAGLRELAFVERAVARAIIQGRGSNSSTCD